MPVDVSKYLKDPVGAQSAGFDASRYLKAPGQVASPSIAELFGAVPPVDPYNPQLPQIAPGAQFDPANIQPEDPVIKRTVTEVLAGKEVAPYSIRALKDAYHYMTGAVVPQQETLPKELLRHATNIATTPARFTMAFPEFVKSIIEADVESAKALYKGEKSTAALDLGKQFIEPTIAAAKYPFTGDPEDYAKATADPVMTLMPLLMAMGAAPRVGRAVRGARGTKVPLKETPLTAEQLAGAERRIEPSPAEKSAAVFERDIELRERQAPSSAEGELLKRRLTAEQAMGADAKAQPIPGDFAPFDRPLAKLKEAERGLKRTQVKRPGEKPSIVDTPDAQLESIRTMERGELATEALEIYTERGIPEGDAASRIAKMRPDELHYVVSGGRIGKVPRESPVSRETSAETLMGATEKPVAAIEKRPTETPVKPKVVEPAPEITAEQALGVAKAEPKAVAKTPGTVDTIAGKLDLAEFERMGYDLSEITQSDWINLQRLERRRLGQAETSGTKNAPYQDYKSYHEEAVRSAIKKGETLEQRVLADYPDLAPKVTAEQVMGAEKPKSNFELGRDVSFALPHEAVGLKVNNAQIKIAAEKVGISPAEARRALDEYIWGKQAPAKPTAKVFEKKFERSTIDAVSEDVARWLEDHGSKDIDGIGTIKQNGQIAFELSDGKIVYIENKLDAKPHPQQIIKEASPKDVVPYPIPGRIKPGGIMGAKPAPVAEALGAGVPDNVYLRMPIERVRKDAAQGVKAAVEALEIKEGKPAKPPKVVSKLVGVERPTATQALGATPTAIKTASSESLRQKADALQKQIDAKRGSANYSANPTARRDNFAQSATMEAERIETIQKKLKTMADLIDKNELPESLSLISDKGQVEALMRQRYPDAFIHQSNIKDLLIAIKGKRGSVELARIINSAQRSETGYTFTENQIPALERAIKIASADKEYSRWQGNNARDNIAEFKRLLRAGIKNERQWQKAKADLEGLTKAKSAEQVRLENLGLEEKRLRLAKEKGFFVTPKTVAEDMIARADIKAGESVLEPSAGLGNIADLLPKEQTKVIEWSSARNQLLKDKGHNVVGDDFLEHTEKYDKIVMNPPFENMQDVTHVQYAYDLLNPGGKVVSIMGEGPFFNSNKKGVAFREWLDEVGGTSEKLPEGSFKEAGTGVNARIVEIEKPIGEGKVDQRLIEQRDRLKSKVEKTDRVTEQRRETDMPGTFITGRSGVPESRTRKLDRQLDRTVKTATEQVEALKELDAVERKIKSQEEAPKHEIIKREAVKRGQEQFDNIEVGDKIDIGGNAPLTVIKKNPNSVITKGGSKWTPDEIGNVTKAPTSKQPIGFRPSEKTFNVPIDKIATDVDRFQNRATEFSEETARAIAENYNPNKIDPITLWKDPKTDKTYVISGHSRLEGLKRRGETNIEATIFEGTETQARNFGIIEANRGASKENLVEDLTAYKRAKSQDYTKSRMKDLFGSNLNTLESIQHLNPKGKFIEILNQPGIATEFPFIKRFATWVGQLRGEYGEKLTTRHESQVFDFLYKEGRKNIDIGRDDFFRLVQKNVDRMDWAPNQPLVLKRGEIPTIGSRARSDTGWIEKELDRLKDLKKEARTTEEITVLDTEITKLTKGIQTIMKSQGDIFGKQGGRALNILRELRDPAGAKRVPFKEAIETPDRPEMTNMESYYKTISAPESVRPPTAKGKLAETAKEAGELGIAMRQTKGGKVVPAVRQAGTFVPEDFANYKNFKDAKQGVAGGTKDLIRYIQEIDGALSPQKKAKLKGQAGPAEKYVLRRTEDIVKIELNWTAEQAVRINDIVKDLNSKQVELVTDVLEQTSRKGSYVKTEDFANSPRIKAITTDQRVIKAAQESRKALEHWFGQQNKLREIRGQELIDYRQYYSPQTLREASLWERTFGNKTKPKDIIDAPQLPDYIKPNKPFNPRALAREFGMEKYMQERRIDKILEDYANTASRDIHHTSIIQNNKAFIQQLEAMGYKNAAEGISNFTAEGFGGVKAAGDRWLNLPRKVTKGMRFWRGSLMRSVFPLNFAWNTTVQTLSSGLTVMRFGVTNSIRGAMDWYTDMSLRNKIKTSYSYRVKSVKAGRITRQDINSGITKMVSTKRSDWQAGIDGTNYLTELIEREITGWSIASGLRHGAKRGLRSNALWDYGSDGGAKTQSMYNMENKPGMIRNESVQTAFPMQTFVFEMYNTGKEFAGKTGTPPGAMTERIGWVLRFTAAAYAGNYIAHAATGRKPWDIYSFIPFSDQTIKPVVDALRGKEYQSTTSRGLPSFVGAGVEFARGVRSYLKTGNSRKLRNWGVKYMTAFAGIPGGTQLARMVDGWIAVADGGMKNAKGKTMFKIEDPWEKTRAVALGPWRTKAGIKYWDERETTLLQDLGITKKKKKKRPPSALRYLGAGGGTNKPKKKTNDSLRYLGAQ